MRLASLAVAVATLAALPACTFIFDGDDPGDDCLVAPQEGGAPTIAPAPLRDPSNLTCQTFGGYGCDPACGPCPAVAEVADLAPIPSWGVCGSPCEGLAELACATDPQCRVIHHAACDIDMNCFTSFLGCFPTDTITDVSINCWTADAWSCSRNNGCTALHSTEACPNGGVDCPRPFELCVPEGAAPGRCYLPVACDALPPPCAAGTTPGIADGCYTGACIPTDLCNPVP